MARLDLDPPVETLLAPTLDGVRAATALLGGDLLRVRLGPAPGFFALDGATIVLSDALAGPDLHHPLDASADVPIDRWRRAAASVIEAAALVSLGRPDPTDWRWLGWAIWQAAQRFPELQVADADLARARRTGSPGSEPRAGFAVMRALEVAGDDPTDRVGRWRAEETIPPEAFLGWGAWALSPRGAQAALSVPVPRPTARDIPVEVPPWTWLPLSVPSSPRGGHVVVDGPGAVADPWGVAGEALHTLAAATDAPARLTGDPGGPVGTWSLSSAEGFGQVMGARGFTFEIAASGALQLVLADAFVGPIAALEMADLVGTSGICRGRWRVAGPFRIALSDLDTSALTMHGHEDPFVVPAQGLGLAESIRSMSEQPWTWRREGRDLWLTGRLRGGPVEIRLQRA